MELNALKARRDGLAAGVTQLQQEVLMLEHTLAAMKQALHYQRGALNECEFTIQAQPEPETPKA